MLAALLLVAAPATARALQHRLAIHVDSADAAIMTEALHNAANAIEAERKHGATVRIEIVANGAGTAMLVQGLSPVSDEDGQMHDRYPNVVPSA